MNRINYSFFLSLLFSLIIASCDSENRTELNGQNEISNEVSGLSFDGHQWKVKVWAPDAASVQLNLFSNCESEIPEDIFTLNSEPGNYWTLSLPQEVRRKAYTFSITRNNSRSKEIVDPFVKAVCANGNRGVFVLVDSLNPEGWESDKGPRQKASDPTVIYELHVRDFSIDSASGMKNKGKYLAFAENGTRGSNGQPSGLDHIGNLGITHIHLLPVFDFASIDELEPDAKYNWGYDPKNYFVPEGSYATDPSKPENRIIEFKSMVQGIHNKGMGVIMDVVYNHTYYLDNSLFQEWAPGYYYRKWDNGSYSNASGCGNEIATEKEKTREMIIASLVHWTEAYHIDGFRFDLMGIMDITTMSMIRDTLEKIRPGIIIYGEGWTAGSSPYPDSLRATKNQTYKMKGVAAFSDEIRDGIKGHWSEEKDKGFISGKKGMLPSVQFGVAGAVKHQQVDYEKVNNSKAPWAANPRQCINYVSCHDNHTLWDKLKISAPEYSVEDRRKMHLMAQTIVLTSQGIPLLHAGTEFYRTKKGEHNSYQSHDSINMIEWTQAALHTESIDYLKSIIEFRKNHDVFRLKSTKDVNDRLRFLETKNDNMLAYSLNSSGVDSSYHELLFIFYAGQKDEILMLPEGNWQIIFSDYTARNFPVRNAVRMRPFNTMILSKN